MMDHNTVIRAPGIGAIASEHDRFGGSAHTFVDRASIEETLKEVPGPV